MSNLEDIFGDLNRMANTPINQRHIMTDEELYYSTVTDVENWAGKIAGEWNGEEPGSREDRATQALEIIEKCQELKELIAGLEEL